MILKSESTEKINKNPTKGFVDLCISDNGITIPGNISKYGLLFETDFESIIAAIKEGEEWAPCLVYTISIPKL